MCSLSQKKQHEQHERSEHDVANYAGGVFVLDGKHNDHPANQQFKKVVDRVL